MILGSFVHFRPVQILSLKTIDKKCECGTNCVHTRASLHRCQRDVTTDAQSRPAQHIQGALLTAAFGIARRATDQRFNLL